MGMETFCRELVDCLKEGMDGDVQISVHKTYKNNDICLHGILISYGNQQCVPSIYVDGYFQKYKMGMMSLGQIVCEVIKERDALEHQRIAPLEELTWENVKDKVFCRLINLGRNKKKLAGMPYMEYLDLAVTCRWLHSADEKGVASAEVTYAELELFGVTKEELFAQARKNTEKLFPVEFQSLLSMIETVRGKKLSPKEVGIEESMDLEADSRIAMYVLTNTTGINGAGVILYPDVLKRIAEQLTTDTLYLLPSSVHEFMVLPECSSVADMKELVTEANHCAVASVDVLSDSVYRYDRVTDRVEIVEE